ncbi:MAG: hypothetical protein ACRDL4_02880 [Thermoleophilaceae bacterium]
MLNMLGAVATGLMAAALALSACGGGESPDRSQGALASKELRARPWGRVEPREQGRLLRVLYLTNRAFELKRVDLRETESQVVITLLEKPPDPGAHTTEGELACVELELAKPLRGRDVLDGARASRPAERELPPGSPTACSQPANIERLS